MSLLSLSESLENNLTKTLSDLVNNQTQNNFLQSSLGQVINGAVDIGIKAALPDVVEDTVIEIKDSFLTEGFVEGVNKAIESAINLGKSAIGIFSGNFENISQAQMAVEEGGIIDGVSNTIDYVLKKATDAGIISKDINKLIKKGKNIILDTVSSNIQNKFDNQIESIEKISESSGKWKEYFNNKDFNNMEKQYKNIMKELNNILPLEEIVSQAKVIENLHTLIKNNGNNFNLTQEQIALTEMLK